MAKQIITLYFVLDTQAETPEVLGVFLEDKHAEDLAHYTGKIRGEDFVKVYIHRIDLSIGEGL